MSVFCRSVCYDSNIENIINIILNNNDIKIIKEIGRIYKKGEYWIYIIIKENKNIYNGYIYIKYNIEDFMNRFSKSNGYKMVMYYDSYNKEEYIERRKYVDINEKSNRWNNRGLLIFDKVMLKEEWVDYINNKLKDMNVYEIGYIGLIKRNKGKIVKDELVRLYICVCLDDKDKIEDLLGYNVLMKWKGMNFIGRNMCVNDVINISYREEKVKLINNII